MLKDSLTNKLPYQEIVDGMVFLKQGKLEVGIEVNFPSSIFSSVYDKVLQWEQMRQAIRAATGFGQRTRFWVENLNGGRKIIESFKQNLNVGDPVVFEMLSGIVDHFKDQILDGKVKERRYYMMTTVSGMKKRPEALYRPDEFRELYQRGRDVRETLISTLKEVDIQARPLGTQEAFGIIYNYLNPSLQGMITPQYVPATLETAIPKSVGERYKNARLPTLRRQLVSFDIDTSDDFFIQSGNTYIRILSLDRMPNMLQIGMVEHLMHALEGHSWVMCMDYQHLRTGAAKRKIRTEASRKVAFVAGGEGNMYVDPANRVAAEMVDGALEYLDAEGDHVYDFGFSVILYAKSHREMEQIMYKASSAFNKLGGVLPNYGRFSSHVNFLEGLLPFGGLTNEYMSTNVERDAAALFPMTGVYRGSERPMVLLANANGELISFDPFDKKSVGPHGLVTGSTRSGKSVLTMKMAMSAFTSGADVMILDQGGGYEGLVDVLRGNTAEPKAVSVIFTADARITINPFDLPAGQLRPSDAQFNNLSLILKSILKPSDDPTVRAIEENLIGAAVRAAFDRKIQSYQVAGGWEERREGQVYISDVAKALTSLNKVGNTVPEEREKEMARGLQFRLQKWLRGGEFGWMMDGPTSVNINAQLVYFDIAGIADQKEILSIAILLISNLIWSRAEQLEKNKYIILDEVWKSLELPEARQMIEGLFRRIAKTGTSVTAASQSISDFEPYTAITANAAYYMLGRNPDDVPAVRRMLQVNDSVAGTFAELKTPDAYREFLACIKTRESKLQGDKVRVALTGLELWAFETNSEKRAARKALIKKHGGDVLRAFCEYAGGVQA